MSQIIDDFLKVGTLRLISRVLMGLRGLFVVMSLSPYVLGEYTIWLLFIFYFSMLDFGVLAGLERDLPHYKGLKDADEVQNRSDVGWSTFFVFSAVASLLLGAISFFVFGQWMLAVLLLVHLFADKVYRSYDANSRIHFLYKENGIAQLIYAVVSLLLIIVLLPYWGPYGILVGFIIAAIVSALYLCQKTRLAFSWVLKIKEFIVCIKNAVPLAAIVYSIQLYHMIALTILAFLCDKVTLGYFAFAFRIFYMCLTIFPFLIQEVMRTRMYFHVAQARKGQPYLEKLFFPMGIYCIITSFFWIFIYWWADWGINRVASNYLQSIETLKLLILALLPLGITKICSDYLCSNVHRKIRIVLLSWLFGVALQGSVIWVLSINQKNLLFNVPVVYLISTFVIYVLVTRASLEVEGEVFPGSMRLIFLWIPLVGALSSVYFLKKIFLFSPSLDFSANIIPFLASLVLMYGLIQVTILLFRKHRRFSAFFSHHN